LFSIPEYFLTEIIVLMKRILLCVLAVMTLCSHGLSENYYVSVRGSSGGTGTEASPWDLQTALNHPNVSAGDTIWVAGGEYRGVFSSSVSGREGAPVIVRAIPGQEVVLDGNVSDSANGVLSINGRYSWFWGLTITNSDATGKNYYKDGVYFVGANSKLINCRIYNNGGNGVGFWRPALNSEIYGCIIFHNGFKGDIRGHGHGIYAQNESGAKLIRDNVLFNSFGIGIHIYTEGGGIQGFVLEGNTIFNSGIPGANFIDRNVIIGGFQEADRIFIRENHFYNRPSFSSKASVQLGYAIANRNAEFSGNTMVDGSLYMVGGWNALQVTDNEMFSRSTDMQLVAFDDFENITNPVFNHNAYYRGSLSNMTFPLWKTLSGQDANSTYSGSLPTTTRHHVIRNRYESGRAQIVVYNWGNHNDLMVDLSAILSTDSYFQIWDVLNFADGPVINGVYNGGAVQIPLNLSDIERPIRADSYRDVLTHTLPAFGVFLVSSEGKGLTTGYGSAVTEVLPLKIKKCYPNPTVDILAMDVYSPKASELVANIYDEAGRLVHNETLPANIGDNTLVINLAKLAGGVYIVTLTDGILTDRCKILKRDFALNVDYEGESEPEPSFQ
jgi:hypothetical protein